MVGKLCNQVKLVSFREPNGVVIKNMKPQRGRSIAGPSLRGLWGRSATGQDGRAAANKEVSAVWSGAGCPKIFRRSHAGRSVFLLTSLFIGLTTGRSRGPECQRLSTSAFTNHRTVELQWISMTTAAFGCLLLGVSSFGLSCASWYIRRSRKEFSELNKSGSRHVRDYLALSALMCATSSAAIYVGFLLLWAYSPLHSLNGRQPLGATVIWVGLVSAFYAIAGGLFARGIQKLLIVASSVAVAFLWILAGAASAAI